MMHRSFLALALALGATACVSPESHRKTLAANDALKSQLAEQSEHMRKLNQDNESMRAELARLQALVPDVEYIARKKAELDALLQRHGGATSGGEGVEVINTPEGIAFRVAGGVLFSSGSDVLSDSGKKALDGLMATLREKPRVRVTGHTDDQPIARSSWQSNLHLSVGRALSVAVYLIQQGLPAAKVSVAGYGEFQPAEAGSTDAARAKNRRVEILMPDR